MFPSTSHGSFHHIRPYLQALWDMLRHSSRCGPSCISEFPICGTSTPWGLDRLAASHFRVDQPTSTEERKNELPHFWCTEEQVGAPTFGDQKLKSFEQAVTKSRHRPFLKDNGCWQSSVCPNCALREGRYATP